MKKIVLVGVIAAVLGTVTLAVIPHGDGRFDEKLEPNNTETIDMSEYATTAPSTALDFLFIHHSCGGQMMADVGGEQGSQCIFRTHENGGGLRTLLQQNNYVVHEASYGSEIGELTDIFHWPEKFKTKMNRVLTCDQQDRFYEDGRRNDIVAFKSCFPNNRFVGEGVAPGNPTGPELTVWNAKAAYNQLLPEFAKHPSVLFVAVTAPPVANYFEPDSLLKAIARKVLGKPRHESGPYARAFNNWLKDKNGWLKEYKERNVIVFDYYDVLTDRGRTNYAAYPTGNGADSHPSAEGNQKAAAAFVPLLNQAVRRAGLVKTE
ncbi:MAG: hypothetical protein QNJ97_12785 [Myxococcota bacterium]|nr:hypothetical protein [Myxococcota bacterium]